VLRAIAEGATLPRILAAVAENIVADAALALERALTVAEVTTILGVSSVTLAQWRAAGRGPRYFIAGTRSVRYVAREVLRWRDAQTRGRPVDDGDEIGGSR
jgi:predicted DNA-binding transcriptional regulator AlpA